MQVAKTLEKNQFVAPLEITGNLSVPNPNGIYSNERNFRFSEYVLPSFLSETKNTKNTDLNGFTNCRSLKSNENSNFIVWKQWNLHSIKRKMNSKIKHLYKSMEYEAPFSLKDTKFKAILVKWVRGTQTEPWPWQVPSSWYRGWSPSSSEPPNRAFLATASASPPCSPAFPRHALSSACNL